MLRGLRGRTFLSLAWQLLLVLREAGDSLCSPAFFVLSPSPNEPGPGLCGFPPTAVLLANSVAQAAYKKESQGVEALAPSTTTP